MAGVGVGGEASPIVSATAWRAPAADRQAVLLHVENRDCWADVEVDALRARELAAQLITAAGLIEPALRDVA
ncbi:hypothetical protein VSH64_42525 [Amycolatopsis rhabdoformis]|uniref:Uncharacterized protein n=1 Tax=Amycolatopsis rhabdoformis TaxID=1448059 RepID=A0ABZ1I4W2_9PSEU|nr:hypothetical protein [Amycolatopsis rhabdoformis]WSE29412.1 hypothetical protein VSH64_42525 [Amycolatopsis rhabdoformis]